MVMNVNELMQEVADCGARLVVQNNRLGIQGELPEDLKAKIREHRGELVRELTWDQERAYTMLREALEYLDRIFVSGADVPRERNDRLHEAVNEAFAGEDMWAFRVARRAWVLAWTEAVAEAKERAA